MPKIGLKIGLRHALVGAVVLGAAATTLSLFPAPAAAESISLEGAWSGGGLVRFPSGESERARCRARFRRSGGSSFEMTAVCATPSARVEQTAQLQRTGANRYNGDFRNNEYNVSGSIVVTVNGNSLHASLSGGGGSAHFNLGR